MGINKKPIEKNDDGDNSRKKRRNFNIPEPEKKKKLDPNRIIKKRKIKKKP